MALSHWLTEQYTAYAALPAQVRALIERCVHFIGIFMLGMAGAMATGIPWKQAAMAALLPAGGGQVSLQRQLPRDPSQYQDRTNDMVVPEDQLR